MLNHILTHTPPTKEPERLVGTNLLNLFLVSLSILAIHHSSGFYQEFIPVSSSSILAGMYFPVFLFNMIQVPKDHMVKPTQGNIVKIFWEVTSRTAKAYGHAIFTATESRMLSPLDTETENTDGNDSSKVANISQ